jgi:hypothetical protein
MIDPLTVDEMIIRARVEALREAAEIAANCFGPQDEALTVAESSGYDLAMGRIEDAIRAHADAIERGET